MEDPRGLQVGEAPEAAVLRPEGEPALGVVDHRIGNQVAGQGQLSYSGFVGREKDVIGGATRYLPGKAAAGREGKMEAVAEAAAQRSLQCNKIRGSGDQQAGLGLSGGH